MKNITRIIILLLIVFLADGQCQDKNSNKGIFVQPREGFYEQIEKTLGDYTPAKNPKKSFKVDFTGIDLPTSENEFTAQWYNAPVSQGRTGTCWCFSTTSYFESEIYRQFHKKVKLSEIYTVYHEYIEKATRFIEERGKSAIGEGSEGNAVRRIWSKYGVVPEDAYTGLKPGQVFHDHKALFHEINAYLQNLKTTNAWDEATGITTVKAILNHYLGEPPQKFLVDGKEYTPQSYFRDYLKLNLSEYIDFFSLKEKPFYHQAEYEVQDNWNHDSSYFNIPVDDFMAAIKSAIKQGYTLAIGGDVSEAGYDGWHNAAIVPSFDIPSGYINDDARQFRFSNGTTGDDHGIHIVGYLEKNGRTWFLIKDSSSGSRNGNAKGFYFYEEDYVRLKMIDFMVHKDAVKELLAKCTEK
jgi:bleomycin hydrolase